MKYDLVIFGGGTSGIACAYTAAKNGLKTLLVEKSDVLGGAITQGLVIPCMKTNDNSINNDFYHDLIDYAKRYNAQITYCDENDGWFNPELLKVVIDDMLESVGCKILYSTEAISIDNIINNDFKIKLIFKMLSLDIVSSYIVDATGFGKIFKILNYNFQNKNKISQTPTLRFNIGNVNLEKFEDWITSLDNNREVTTSCHIDGQIHLSTAYTSNKDIAWALEPVFAEAIEADDLTEEDCSYFQLFTIPNMPNTVTLNCPRIIPNGDINEPFTYAESLMQGRKKIFKLFKFCKKYLPGFENSCITSISDTLGVREDYRIKGKYTYTLDDLKSSKEFDNIAFSGDYPIDIHSNEDNSTISHERIQYFVPIEALMSEENEKVFAIGRCLSADFEAQSALRIQRHCFSMGEAVAKYIKSKELI